MAQDLKGLGFSRAAKSFYFVIPSRPEPRLRGEDDEESAFSRSVKPCPIQPLKGHR
jgi:hypothetical protein